MNPQATSVMLPDMSGFLDKYIMTPDLLSRLTMLGDEEMH